LPVDLIEKLSFLQKQLHINFFNGKMQKMPLAYIFRKISIKSTGTQWKIKNLSFQ